ncbi:bifunctional coenzyme A synthase isoform X2 [Lissotriton helveticus]
MSVFRSGVLVLTSPLSSLSQRIVPILSSAARIVQDTLYVHLQPGLSFTGSTQPRSAYITATHEVCNLIRKVYFDANVHSHLDVRVLLTNIRNQNVNQHPLSSVQNLSHPPEVVLTDFQTSDGGQYNPVKQRLERYATSCYSCKPNLISVLLYPEYSRPDEDTDIEEVEDTSSEVKSYSDVVVGGTFDRLHNAHKIFLSVSCLLAESRLLIGLSDRDLLKRKILKELIEPFDSRAEKLGQFLVDIKPSLTYDIVPLFDPYGLSITDADLKCIVVSEETRKGGEAVNRKRLENGLPALVLHEIKIVNDAQHAQNEEEKISSSSLRSRILGTLLKPPTENLKIPLRPYVIGLTGGSGSGKSAIAKYLANLGAALIDSDKLGHETYSPGGPAYQQVVEEFGPEVVNDDGTINRRILGQIVFADKTQLKRLTDIVWPAIATLAKQKIADAATQGATVCVMDAAVLLEAGWTDMVHEVWVTIIPEKEAITRIMERDGVSEESAKHRLANQMTNCQRVEHANVVLCTLWEPEVTQNQVQKAWNLLLQRIGQEFVTPRPLL